MCCTVFCDFIWRKCWKFTVVDSVHSLDSAELTGSAAGRTFTRLCYKPRISSVHLLVNVAAWWRCSWPAGEKDFNIAVICLSVCHLAPMTAGKVLLLVTCVCSFLSVFVTVFVMVYSHAALMHSGYWHSPRTASLLCHSRKREKIWRPSMSCNLRVWDNRYYSIANLTSPWQ